MRIVIRQKIVQVLNNGWRGDKHFIEWAKENGKYGKISEQDKNGFYFNFYDDVKSWVFNRSDTAKVLRAINEKMIMGYGNENEFGVISIFIDVSDLINDQIHAFYSALTEQTEGRFLVENAVKQKKAIIIEMNLHQILGLADFFQKHNEMEW